jgi:hypothetical protein
LFTVGLVTYEASVDRSALTAASDSTITHQTDEGGGDIPGDNLP